MYHHYCFHHHCFRRRHYCCRRCFRRHYCSAWCYSTDYSGYSAEQPAVSLLLLPPPAVSLLPLPPYAGVPVPQPASGSQYSVAQSTADILPPSHWHLPAAHRNLRKLLSFPPASAPDMPAGLPAQISWSQALISHLPAETGGR